MVLKTPNGGNERERSLGDGKQVKEASPGGSPAHCPETVSRQRLREGPSLEPEGLPELRQS